LLRRIAYFLSLAATFHIAAFWLFHPLNPSHEFTSHVRLVSESVRLIGSVLPRAFHWWTDWYAANPEWFAGGIVVIVFFTLIGSALSAKISDSMRIAWRSKGTMDPLPHSFTHSVISTVRNNKAYQWFIRSLRIHVLWQPCDLQYRGFDGSILSWNQGRRARKSGHGSTLFARV
jgi:hypothetical protein